MYSFWAPVGGLTNRMKHVEHFADINELCNVASCWLYLKIHSWCTDPWTSNLCDVLHYSSTRSFCEMAGSTAIAAAPVYHEQGSTYFTSMHCSNIRFPITTVKNALETVSFVHRTHQSMTDMFTEHWSAPVEFEECSLLDNDYSYVLYPFRSPTRKNHSTGSEPVSEAKMPCLYCHQMNSINNAESWIKNHTTIIAQMVSEC
jgi:hypothetical protein